MSASGPSGPLVTYVLANAKAVLAFLCNELKTVTKFLPQPPKRGQRSNI